MANFLLLLLLLLLFSLWLPALPSPAATAASGRIPALIVFGDSTVDAGNNNGIKTVLKSDFRPYGRDFPGGKPTGRFCNGRLATDFIAEALGLGATVPAYLDPARSIRDFATAVCFASAGTGLDNATSDVLNVIPFWKELRYFRQYRRRLRQYLGAAAALRTIREALYIVSIGTNDFLENYFLLVTGRFKEFSVGEFEDFLVGIAGEFLTAIYRLGARKVMFTGLSPIGCLPLERTANLLRGGGCVEEYNAVAREFNGKIDAMVAELRAALPEFRLSVNGVYDLLLDMIENPSRYGFENVNEGCCGTGRFEMSYLCNDLNPHTCEDANKYVFWDAFHPTQKVNYLIAQHLFNATLVEFLK
ncbi:GDSL esterase/lipase [Apostasia shenzhenica]|uniref:GDSL esterase/lipase n=1 Tax=Apostasia shenzhenica TaxID=1088818 RepID=A0A2I0A513_9ASPA|nr:GDSL esterase/lipase [Apostasia shenzhenica]